MYENNVEGKPPNPLQIYTIAHARRYKPGKENSTRIPLERKSSISYNEKIALQVKETLKEKVGNRKINPASTQKQPLSHLPMKMIVSKMATRNHVQPTESNNVHDDFDVSIYRHLKLKTPPWRNKQYQAKRRRPTAFEKMIEEMKEKCAQFNTKKRYNPTIQSQGGNYVDLEKIVIDEKSDSWSTSSLQYDYDQLYKKRPKLEEQKRQMIYDTEDPLEFSVTNTSVRSVQQCPEESAYRELPSFSPVQQEPDFVWNPVIVSQEPKEDLFSVLKGSTDNFEMPLTESFSQYGPEPIHYRCLPNNEYYNDNYAPGFYDYEQFKTPNAHLESEYDQEDSNHHLFQYDSPESPALWEGSSTSSGQTIAEERLQFTYYSMRNPRKRPIISPTSPEFLNEQKTVWSSSMPCFNFYEE